MKALSCLLHSSGLVARNVPLSDTGFTPSNVTCPHFVVSPPSDVILFMMIDSITYLSNHYLSLHKEFQFVIGYESNHNFLPEVHFDFQGVIRISITLTIAEVVPDVLSIRISFRGAPRYLVNRT